MSAAHVLVIEDDRIQLCRISDCLRAQGFEVSLAPDGRAGVEHARKRLPDLILCDVVLPFLDGYGVLAELKRTETTQGIPILLMTRSAEGTGRMLALELGATDYLAKPIADDELIRIIEERLAGVRALRNYTRLPLTTPTAACRAG